MGCDIHTIVEVYEDGEWVFKTSEIFETRDYVLFAFLANVRNDWGIESFKFSSLPDDLSNTAEGMVFADWWARWDYHSFGSCTLRELLDAVNQRQFSEKEVKAFGHLYHVRNPDVLKALVFDELIAAIGYWQQDTEDNVRLVFAFDN